MTATKLRGHRKLDVIRDLALDMETQVALAAKYDVTQPAISAFAHDYAEQIASVRLQYTEDASEELVNLKALWVTEKARRIAEYQQTIEDVNTELDRFGSQGLLDARLITKKHEALKAVAEELGDLPVRQQIQQSGSTIVYTIEGIPGDKLRAGLT
jgi:hypothetical protein